MTERIRYETSPDGKTITALYGSTENCLKVWERFKDSIGKVNRVDCNGELTSVTGSEKKLVLNGCNCGYGGGGPHGTAQILRELGMSGAEAEQLIQMAPMAYEVGSPEKATAAIESAKLSRASTEATQQLVDEATRELAEEAAAVQSRKNIEASGECNMTRRVENYIGDHSDLFNDLIRETNKDRRERGVGVYIGPDGFLTHDNVCTGNECSVYIPIRPTRVAEFHTHPGRYDERRDMEPIESVSHGDVLDALWHELDTVCVGRVFNSVEGEKVGTVCTCLNKKAGDELVKGMQVRHDWKPLGVEKL